MDNKKKEPLKKKVNKKVVKKVDKKEPVKKVVKEPVKKVNKKVDKIIIEYNVKKDETDEIKYSGKLNKLLFKIKSQNLDTDNRIRFCWKN